MKSFSRYLKEETSYRRKGYIHVNTGKMVLFPFTGRSIRPFHTEYVLKNANKFIRGGEDALLRKFAHANGFEPEDEETQSMWVDIKTGKVDRDPNLDSIIEAEGWRRVVFDEGISSVEPVDRREGQKLVKMILDKIPWKNIENLNVFDRGHLNDMTSIYSEEDAIQYVKTGRLAQRTSIGRTMAQFREEIDKAEFRAHWKKAPILTTGGGNVKQRNQFWDSYFKHFEDKYGPIPNRIKDAMRQADMKPNPSITHKGKKFSMRTGMDEMDLLYHVLSEDTLTEQQFNNANLIKGWMSPKGKLVLHPESNKHKFHLQILTQMVPYEEMRPHMSEFIGSEHLKFLQGLKKDGTANFTKEQIKDLIEREYEAVYKRWATGRDDSDRIVEGRYVDMGWVKIVIDRNQYGMSAIEGSDRQILKCAKKLDKMFGGWEGFGAKSMMVSTKTSVSRIGSAIRDSAGWDHYLKTGQVRRQTEIGRKMAQFREFVEKYEFMLPDFPEQIPADEDEGDWAMGDPPVPIKWTGDHKKMYRDVMKDRKKKNPKYKVPKGPHTGI